MERHRPAPASISPDAARQRLDAARHVHDASVRRAMNPLGLILALSFFCGAMTLAPSHHGPGSVVTIAALVWFVAELLRLSARNQWQALRSLPRPRWNLIEVTLLGVAVLVGGLVGPHLLAAPGNSALASWALAVGVAVIVAVCLLAANASYRHRSSRAWRR